MRGYWSDDVATAEAISPAGWMRTGDLAVMEENGTIRLVGRINDVIIRGGENIYPREIEELLRSHPDVAEAHVTGIPHERYGEQVMAWVRLIESSRLGASDLASYCIGRISRSKIPSLWRFTDAFPTTASGKVQKFRMRQIAMEGPGDSAQTTVATCRNPRPRIP